MAQTTEATCLLQSGSMYARRIGLRTRSGEDLFAGVKPGGVSIYFDDAPIFHFDLDGRWQRAFIDGVHYLKGLDATVRSIDREREGESLVLRRKILPYARAVDLDASIRSMALDLIDDLNSNRREILPTPPKAQPFTPEEFRSFLERVSRWDSASWFSHRERYLDTYNPIPFLPPNCQNALVLQATLGDVDGFAFGRARATELYVRSPGEFRDHLEVVSRLIGRRLAQHRGIFLGGADVLRRPVRQILEYLESIKLAFPAEVSASEGWDDFLPQLGTVNAFLDDFQGQLPDLDGWRSLQATNLGRLTLGIESGDPSIRSIFGKSWKNQELWEVVVNLKAAGIGVGLVILIGPGGPGLRETHLASTSELLGSLPLEDGDLISLVDIRSLDESSSEEDVSISDAEAAAQVAVLKSRLFSDRSSKGPKVVAYNPRKQWN